jgi:hypothetical protein
VSKSFELYTYDQERKKMTDRKQYLIDAIRRAAWDRIATDRTVLAAALIEWQPGDLIEMEDAEGIGFGRLIHGNFASRNCTGGFPTQRILRFGERSFWSGIVTGSANHTYAFSDWQERPSDVTPTTQPSPGYKLSFRSGDAAAAREALEKELIPDPTKKFFSERSGRRSCWK